MSHVSSMWHGPKACTKRTGAAASVARRRHGRLARAGQSMQAGHARGKPVVLVHAYARKRMKKTYGVCDDTNAVQAPNFPFLKEKDSTKGSDQSNMHTQHDTRTNNSDPNLLARTLIWSERRAWTRPSFLESPRCTDPSTAQHSINQLQSTAAQSRMKSVNQQCVAPGNTCCAAWAHQQCHTCEIDYGKSDCTPLGSAPPFLSAL